MVEFVEPEERGDLVDVLALLLLDPFRIEASYRLSESTIISTTTQDPTRRLLFVVLSLLLQNVWRYLHWKYVATPRRGGRRLWWWPFEEFIDMVTRAAWTALAVRRAVPANRPPDDCFHR